MPVAYDDVQNIVCEIWEKYHPDVSLRISRFKIAVLKVPKNYMFGNAAALVWVAFPHFTFIVVDVKYVLF